MTDDAALHALGPAWDWLWRCTIGASPFISPHWLLPWWRQFGTGRPHVVTLHHDGTLAGVLPLYVYQDRLLPIGAGTSDLLDALASDDGDAEAMLAFALDQARELTRCDLVELPPHARLLSVACSWESATQSTGVCPVLPLGTALETCVPSGMLRKLRMGGHRAERAGGARFEMADADSLPRLQTALHALHQGRWTAQGEAGSFADAAVTAMHAESAPALLAAGLLRQGAIHLRGDLAATILALLSPGRIYFYASGFDPRFSFESPGTLLLGHMLRTAIAEGRTHAEFLRGGESYKHAWGAIDRPNAMRLLRR